MNEEKKTKTKQNRISVWPADQSFQLNSLTCITASSDSNRHETVSSNDIKKHLPSLRGQGASEELDKPFRTPVAFPAPLLNFLSTTSSARMTPLNSAGTAKSAHNQLQKYPFTNWYMQHL